MFTFHFLLLQFVCLRVNVKMTESGDYLKRKHPIQPDIKGTFKKLKTPAELNVIAQSSSSSDNMKSSMAICTELEKHESNNSIGQNDIVFALEKLSSGKPLNDYDRDFFLHKRWKPSKREEYPWSKDEKTKRKYQR